VTELLEEDELRELLRWLVRGAAGGRWVKRSMKGSRLVVGGYVGKSAGNPREMIHTCKHAQVVLANSMHKGKMGYVTLAAAARDPLLTPPTFALTQSSS
jgi:hypothetical protein